jgi:pSer/pThr/pTyr-binding forkhead associated (FHA) protein
MNTLILEWIGNNGASQRQTITDTDLTKIPGRFRIGRDRHQCDLVIDNNTVSRLHIEIWFSEPQRSFLLRNLAPNNTPMVDGQRIGQGEIALRQGSRIILGQILFNVVSVEESLGATVVVAPPDNGFQRGNQHHQNHQHQNHQQQASPEYGLECPRCRKISDYSRLNVGCRWCGTSLGAAASMLIIPERR